MLKPPPRSGRWIAAVAPLLLLTACTTDETAKVSVDQVVGHWQGPDGEEITFSAGRKFTASGLDSKKLAGEDCPGGKSAGGWGFFVDDANGSHMSKVAKSGSQIGIGLARKYWDWNCTMNFAVVDDGKTLCATNDPDVPCGLDVRFTHRK